MSTETREPSERQKMKSMTELAGGELRLHSDPTTKWERVEEEELVYQLPSHWVLGHVVIKWCHCTAPCISDMCVSVSLTTHFEYSLQTTLHAVLLSFGDI